MTLKELQIGKSAIVDAVGGAGALRQHFLDMGLIPGAEVTLVKLAPMGDPMELRIHGYELTLRLDDAAQITVTPTEKTPAVHTPVDGKMVEHPGLGEGGKYHTKEGEHPLPEDKTLTFALAGNQNCGKTTLFNQLTGSNQHVGNFPGVTVDRKSGAIKGHPETEVTDLPGIYSMSPYSSEEIVTRQFIIGEKPTGIINIVDATNIERNLYLTMQLMELDIPMVLALNMMDEMRGNGGTVRINKMEAMLGIPVIPISAAKNEGVDELVDHAVHVAKYQERPGRMDFCSEDDHGGAVHRCIHGILHLIEDHAKAAGIPVRFAATKLVEGDPRIDGSAEAGPQRKRNDRAYHRADGAGARAGSRRRHCGYALLLYSGAGGADGGQAPRKQGAAALQPHRQVPYRQVHRHPGVYRHHGSGVLPHLQCHGLFFQNLMEMGIDALTGVVDTALTNWNVNAAVHSLVIDGIFTGVGSVLSFLPIIVVLFFFLSMLEDTGYMARVAFVMDKLLRRIGLSGRSIVPMLIGFWLHRARRDGKPHPALGARPQNDHSAYAVHELLGKAAHLQPVCGGLLPPICRACDGAAVLHRHSGGRTGGAAAQEHRVQGRGRALCHGAAQLPPARPEERGAAAVGKGAGLLAEGLYGHLCRYHRHLVPAEL